jgi:hypothetical protein
MTTPPPRPVKDPRKPATSEPNQMMKVNSRMFIYLLILRDYNSLPAGALRGAV